MGVKMMRRIAPFLVAVVLLVSAIKPAPALMMNPAAPAVPTSAAGLGIVGGVAGGIIATAAILCFYDIWLKINGFKNWDGTPKIVHVHHHLH
jgi:hypothetical protein